MKATCWTAMAFLFWAASVLPVRAETPADAAQTDARAMAEIEALRQRARDAEAQRDWPAAVEAWAKVRDHPSLASLPVKIQEEATAGLHRAKSEENKKEWAARRWRFWAKFAARGVLGVALLLAIYGACAQLAQNSRE
jgi:hypothetical protein